MEKRLAIRNHAWGGVAAGCLIGGMLVGFAPLDSDAVHATKTVEAIQEVAPEAIADAEGTTQTADPAVAVTADSAGARVTVPTDPADGIQVEGLSIGLPFAQTADNATASPFPGIVVYDNNNGSTTVPVIRERGTVQITTVIENAHAPKRYDYPLQLTTGQALHVNEDGSVIAAGEARSPSVYVAAPWAKDADGNDVPTHYEVMGNTLTQVVDFTATTAFPVVADPTASVLWWGEAVKLSKTETRTLNNNFSPAYFSTVFCGYLGPAAPACGLAASVRLWSWQKPIQDAANQGRCAQLNVPWASGIALWNVTNEAC